MSKKKLSKILVWLGLFFMAFALTMLAAVMYNFVNIQSHSGPNLEEIKSLSVAAIIFGVFAMTSICGGIVCKLLACKDCKNKTSTSAQ
jgi:hypothetical protein